ncbi:MAG: DUF6715 family protein [Butyrivibrio sp.]
MKVLSKIKTPLIITFLAVLAVSYYFYLSNRDVGQKNENKEETAVSKLINRDLDLNYPSTEREVMIYYSDILKVLYKGELTEDELIGLAQHIRGLFDDELLECNPYDTYISDLKEEVEYYKSNDRYVSDYIVEDYNDTVHQTLNGKKYTKIDVKYFVREGKKLIYTYEEFTLRKDEDGKWKILFWTLTEDKNIGE